MLVIPAIDLKGGRCVRLLQGDPDRETVYSDNPVEVARQFQSLGAKLIHVVDLDGAFSGKPINHGVVAEIARTLTVPIEIGGGIRKANDITLYLKMGIKRIILGTTVLRKEFHDIVKSFRENIIVGIDAKNSMVATHGWKTVSSLNSAEVIRDVLEAGLREIIYTDIATDGMLTGPNIKAISGIVHMFSGIRLIASGGVASLTDIENLRTFSDRGLVGCIVGKAIYDGRVNLSEALLLE